MATIIAQCGTENRHDAQFFSYSDGGGNSKVGQTFSGNGKKIGSCVWNLMRQGTGSGNLYAKIYNISAGIPTGAALATSALITSSNVGTTTYGLYTFSFSGANQITLEDGTTYGATIECDAGDSGANRMLFGVSPSDVVSGNFILYYDGSPEWWIDTSWDAIFYIYDNQVTLTDSRTIYTKSKGIVNSNRTILTNGHSDNASARDIYIEGWSGWIPANSTRGIYTIGKLSNSSTKSIYTRGGVSSARNIYSEGKHRNWAGITGGQGMISTKVGKDITTTNPLDWNINTNYPMFKIHSITRGTFAGSNVTINHNLGYYPIVMVWFGYGDEYWYMVPAYMLLYAGVSTDDEKVVLYGDDDMKYICYIFYDEQ